MVARALPKYRTANASTSINAPLPIDQPNANACARSLSDCKKFVRASHSGLSLKVTPKLI